MKCEYCGGEVPAKSTKCPYCGRENQSGLQFQREIREKEERNKALPEQILKENRPWLTQKILTRVIVTTAVLNVLLFISTFFMFLWEERQPEMAVPETNSHAEAYQAQFEVEDYYYGRFLDDMQDYIGTKADGEELPRYKVEDLFISAYNLTDEIYDGNMDAEEKEEADALLDVFFTDYIGIPEEYSLFYRADEWEDTGYEKCAAARDAACAWLCEKEGME